MYTLLEQAVSTWLNRIFLPGNNGNHNSNGLGYTTSHSKESDGRESQGKSAQPRNQRYFCFFPDLSELMKNVPRPAPLKVQHFKEADLTMRGVFIS